MSERYEGYQSLSTLDVVGLVKDLDYEVKDGVVKGKITVTYGDEKRQIVTIDMYQMKEFSSGKENQSFSRTVDNLGKIVTLSKATKENPATPVSITNGNPDFAPSVSVNKYYDLENEEVKSSIRAQLGLFTSVMVDETLTEEDFGAQFTMDLAIVGAPRRDENDFDTLLIDGAMIDYNGAVHKVTLTCRNEEIIEHLEELEGLESIEHLAELCEEFNGSDVPVIEAAQVRLWGEVSLANITETKEVESGFGGKAKTEKTKIFTSELLITGGQMLEDGQYDMHDLLVAYNNQEEYEAGLKQKAEEREQKKSSSNKGGFRKNNFSGKGSSSRGGKGKF